MAALLFGGFSGQAFSPLGEKGRFVLPPLFRNAVKESSDGRVLCLDKHPRFTCLVGFGLSRQLELETQLVRGRAREHRTVLRPEVDDDLAPVVNHTLEVFGPDRVMFGGDWPVCLLGVEKYADWATSLATIVKNRPEEEQKKLFHDNAVKLFNLQDRV